MSELLSKRPRPAVRAAIHGFGHLLRCGGGAAWAGDADQLLVEYLAGRIGKPPDASLAGYAEVARRLDALRFLAEVVVDPRGERLPCDPIGVSAVSYPAPSQVATSFAKRSRSLTPTVAALRIAARSMPA